MVHIQVPRLLTPLSSSFPQDRVGLRVQTALTAAIYSKTLKLSNVSKQALTGATDCRCHKVNITNFSGRRHQLDCH